MSIKHALHRATVSYADAVTGEIRVVAPSLSGTDKEITISLFGREPAPVESGGYKYNVPALGQKIVVASDDVHLTNVFIIETWR